MIALYGRGIVRTHIHRNAIGRSKGRNAIDMVEVPVRQKYHLRANPLLADKVGQGTEFIVRHATRINYGAVLSGVAPKNYCILCKRINREYLVIKHI